MPELKIVLLPSVTPKVVTAELFPAVTISVEPTMAMATAVPTAIPGRMQVDNALSFNAVRS